MSASIDGTSARVAFRMFTCSCPESNATDASGRAGPRRRCPELSVHDWQRAGYPALNMSNQLGGLLLPDEIDDSSRRGYGVGHHREVWPVDCRNARRRGIPEHVGNVAPRHLLDTRLNPPRELRAHVAPLKGRPTDEQREVDSANDVGRRFSGATTDR